MEAEGVQFAVNAHVGGNVELKRNFDAVLIAAGAQNPRDLLEFLPQQNKRVAGDRVANQILPTGKRVIIIIHEEGGERMWSIAPTKLTGDENGNVTKLHGIHVGGSETNFEAIPGTEFTLDADLVLLAMGFTGPIKEGLLASFGRRSTIGATSSRRWITSVRPIPKSSPQAMHAADSLWWFGRSPKAERQRIRSTRR